MARSNPAKRHTRRHGPRREQSIGRAGDGEQVVGVDEVAVGDEVFQRLRAEEQVVDIIQRRDRVEDQGRIVEKVRVEIAAPKTQGIESKGALINMGPFLRGKGPTQHKGQQEDGPAQSVF